MYTPSAIAATQHFLIWILLGFLVAWMILFLLLALRPEARNVADLEELAMDMHDTLDTHPSPTAMRQMVTVQSVQPNS